MCAAIRLSLALHMHRKSSEQFYDLKLFLIIYSFPGKYPGAMLELDPC
jgi:hypothetical protein